MNRIINFCKRNIYFKQKSTSNKTASDNTLTIPNSARGEPEKATNNNYYPAITPQLSETALLNRKITKEHKDKKAKTRNQHSATIYGPFPSLASSVTTSKKITCINASNFHSAQIPKNTKALRLNNIAQEIDCYICFNLKDIIEKIPKSVVHLELEDFFFSKEDIELLSENNHIKSLNLSKQTLITYDTLKPLAKMENLEKINLYNCNELKKINLYDFTKFTKLKVIYHNSAKKETYSINNKDNNSYIKIQNKTAFKKYLNKLLLMEEQSNLT